MNIPSITHVTSLNNLYKILNTGEMLSRTESGNDRLFSATTMGDPNYIYFSISTEKPLFGNATIYLKRDILLERNDYYLNTEWSYGVNSNSLRSYNLLYWLSLTNIFGEILFENKIYIDDYLEKIVIRTLPSYIIEILAQTDPKIYEKYLI